MKKLVSWVIVLTMLFSSGVFVYADENEGSVPETVIEGSVPEETEEQEETEPSEDPGTVTEEVTSEDQDTEEQSDADVSESEETSAEVDDTDPDLPSETEAEVDADAETGDVSEPDEDLIERYVSINVSDDIFEPEEVTYVEYVDVSEVSPSDKVFATFEDAGPYLRQQFKNRASTIKFSVKVPDDQDDLSYYDDLRPVLLEQTGNYDEGDYFRYMDDIDTFEYVELDGYYQITIKYAYITTLRQEQALSAEIDKVLDDLDVDGKSDVEKVYAIHKYMTDNITYDYDTLFDDSYLLKYTAYAALMNKTAVCNGYALLFYRMAGEAGVETRYMAGGDHAWNFVVLDGTAYLLDTTWDSGLDPSQYNYFLTGTKTFFLSHEYYPEYEYLFFEYNFSVSDYSQPFGIDELTDHMGDVTVNRNSNGSVTLSTTPDAGSNIDGYYIQIYPAVNNKSVFWYAGRSLSYKLTGLVPGVAYDIYVYPVHYDYDMNEHFGRSQSFIVTIGEGLQGDPYGKWYLDSNGQYHFGWKKIDDQWYYFYPLMVKGWNTINGKKYHFDEYTGVMDTGWFQADDEWGNTSWYYSDSNGLLQTGWKKFKNKWYYFRDDGVMSTGWDYIKGEAYYFDQNGSMHTGWLHKEEDNWWYYCSSSGEILKGWQKISGKWYYFDKDTYIMQTGWQKISGKWYYFETSGAMVTGWKKLSGKWYYFDNSGTMKTGWLKYDGSWYYLSSNGSMVVSTTVRISGKNYKFNSSGVCTNP